MNFNFSDEQNLLIETTKSFVKNELIPHENLLETIYDESNNRYLLHFSKLGDYNISVRDSEGKFQKKDLKILQFQQTL